MTNRQLNKVVQRIEKLSQELEWLRQDNRSTQQNTLELIDYYNMREAAFTQELKRRFGCECDFTLHISEAGEQSVTVRFYTEAEREEIRVKEYVDIINERDQLHHQLELISQAVYDQTGHIITANSNEHGKVTAIKLVKPEQNQDEEPKSEIDTNDEVSR